MSDTPLQESNPSKVYVLFYSFFLIPLMIAVIGTSFFIIVKFLTLEPKSASDLLNDVKIGSATKRWQSAFELSKILVNETFLKQIILKQIFLNLKQIFLNLKQIFLKRICF